MMLAVRPRITGGCRPDCPDAWKVKPGVIRATPSRLSMPAACRSSPSKAETLAGTRSNACDCLFTVTVTTGSSCSCTGCAAAGRVVPNSASSPAAWVGIVAIACPP